MLEFREGGPARELALELLDPLYDGLEGFWTARGPDWIIHASHESSMTFGGRLRREGRPRYHDLGLTRIHSDALFMQNVRTPATPHWRRFEHGERSLSSGAEPPRSESARRAPEVAVRLSCLALERVAALTC